MNIEKLTELFTKFPGIGPRQAKRFVYFLAREDATVSKELGKLLLEIKSDIKQCPSCFRYYNIEVNPNSNECDICVNLNRDKNILMIVEKDLDLENIEKTHVFNGKYFVLGGTVSLTDTKEASGKIKLRELFESVKKNQPKEIILATSANIEGENTARYVERILEPLLTPLQSKITRLGRGLSTGTELEYIDSETMDNALENRR